MTNSYPSFKQEDNVLVHTRLLDAPRDLVWEVWTNPEHLKEWWGPNDFSITTQSMEAAPGKVWHFIMHGMGRDWDNRIEYIEVKKPSFLSYRQPGKGAAHSFSVSVSLEEWEGKTILTMKSVFESKAIIDELNKKVNAIEGGKQTLTRLENYVRLLAQSTGLKK